MAYALRFKASAQKSLASLPRHIQAQVKTKTSQLTEIPRPVGSIKLSGQENLYRIRLGNYRVIYQIDDSLQIIEITIVAHRREVYRDL